MIEQIRRRLAVYAANEIESEGQPRAAVLLPLYTLDGDLHVVLTKRTDRVQNHKGEISFPGGAREEADFDLAFTALRECEEEIGLDRGNVELIGRLDDIITISDFVVSAYVGLINPAACPYSWLPQEEEVAEILEVPLSHLVDPQTVVQFERVRNGSARVMQGYRFGEHVIWGATGSILRNFLEVALSEDPVVQPS